MATEDVIKKEVEAMKVKHQEMKTNLKIFEKALKLKINYLKKLEELKNGRRTELGSEERTKD